MRPLLFLLSVSFCLAACHRNHPSITPEEARVLARDAYIYGFPLVDNLRVQYAYFTDTTNPEFKAPYNHLYNIPRVFTPDDKIIQTPNSDTPYSWIGLDLRAEPIVFTVPPIEKDRYWSLQLIDLYTHNFAYLGSRATGNEGGSFLVAGPDWKGDLPAGIKQVIRCETSIASAQFRTQLYNPADLDNVKKIQGNYLVQPLSAFLGKPSPKALAPISFPKPLSVGEERSSLAIFQSLNFALQFCPVHTSETELRERFARIGLGAGKIFDSTVFSPQVQAAMRAGIADAWKQFGDIVQQGNEGKFSASDIFGTREYLKNNYLFRMVAAATGIYGNSKEEAMYPNFYVDADGRTLDGANRYILRFEKGRLPPVNSFWSLTMYDEKDLLVANPINRYLVNSTMMNQFKFEPDGSLTLYIQRDSPGKTKEANWLPAPAGTFRLVLRLYWPKEEALNGQWKSPVVNRVSGA